MKADQFSEGNKRHIYKLSTPTHMHSMYKTKKKKIRYAFVWTQRIQIEQMNTNLIEAILNRYMTSTSSDQNCQGIVKRTKITINSIKSKDSIKIKQVRKG